MGTLIEDLLSYSRLSRADLPLQTLDLATVIAQAYAQLEAELQATGAQVIVEKPLPQVIGHAATLVQVIVNLLTNAIKFVLPGVQPQVCVWAEAEGTSIRLRVQDNGLGIASEHQERIFQVFERLHGIESYLVGIGLAIVRKGVERMRGRVGVESQLGEGSRFWLALPRAESQ